MSVPLQVPYKKYTAAPAATTFPTTFRVVLAGDLQVSVDGVIVTTGFTLSGLGVPSGLDVVFSSPMVGGEVVELQRIIPKSRATDYQQLGNFDASVVNADLDRIWQSVQELGEEASRSLRLPPSASGTTTTTLPAPLPLAFLGWNSLGTAIQNYAGPAAVAVSDFMASVVAALDAAAARLLLGAAKSGANTDLTSVGAVTGVTASTSDKSTKLATTAHVHAVAAAREVNLLADYLAGTVGTATENTAALTAAIAALPSGGVINIGRVVGDFPLNPVTVGSPNITLVAEPTTTLRWSTLGTNTSAITVNANYFAIRGGVYRGPGTVGYVSEEKFLKMLGTSTSSRKIGLSVHNAEIYNFGSDGIYVQFVDKIDIVGNYIHNCGYSGASFLSCDNGVFEKNTIDTITPGTGGDMYGVTLTHNSAGYSADPNAGTKQATNPFCRGWVVSGNEVNNIDWQGIDTHGAYEVQIVHNRVYACRYGISCPTSSGAAINYAGYQNDVSHNIIDAFGKAGTTGREGSGHGINLNGGSSLNHARITCIGNIIRGHGVTSAAPSGAIIAAYCAQAVIANNVLERWAGCGIYFGSSTGLIHGNTFGAVLSGVDTVGRCINIDFGANVDVSIVGNAHHPGSGNIANVGIYVAGLTGTPKLFASGNNLLKASVGSLSGTSYSWRGGQFGNQIGVADGDTTPSIKELQGDTRGTILVPITSPYTITAFDDAPPVMELTIFNAGSANLTLARAGLGKFIGAANIVLIPEEAVTLFRFTDSGGTGWRQAAPLAANA